MKYRADIDGLRAIAVIPVVLYHAGVPGFGGGFVGVDIFFVISGYLICGMIDADIRKGSFSLGNFYKRRILRILPALFAMFLGHQLPRLPLFPAGRTAGLFEESSPARSARSRTSISRKPPTISMRWPTPNHCCIPGRSAWKSSSTSSFRS